MKKSLDLNLVSIKCEDSVLILNNLVFHSRMKELIKEKDLVLCERGLLKSFLKDAKALLDADVIIEHFDIDYEGKEVSQYLYENGMSELEHDVLTLYRDSDLEKIADILKSNLNEKEFDMFKKNHIFNCLEVFDDQPV